jgi:hypothetical protein
MGPSCYKPDNNDRAEDKVIEKATRLPKSDRIDEDPSKRTGWRLAKAL